VLTLHALRTALLVGPALADTFWREAALNAVSPVLASLLGGLVVGSLVRWAQGRRERQQLRSALSFDMMRTAYSFYQPLIEAIRREHYTGREAAGRHFIAFRGKAWQRQRADLGELAQQYKEFRIAARMIEEQLRVNFPDVHARWLWHGAVDMLSARYFHLAKVPERFNDMIKVHGEHAADPEIPEDTRKLFMAPAEYRDGKTVDAELLRRYEIFLDAAIRVALRHKIDPPSGAAVLRPGRGSLGLYQASSASGHEKILVCGQLAPGWWPSFLRACGH
jgi:hypothetical protein